MTFSCWTVGVPALLHYGPQKNSKKLQKNIGNIINDWLIAENSCNVFYILNSKTFLQTIFLYISKNYNDPLYIAIMSKFGQLSMHACMNQIATLISKNEREVLKKKIGHDLEDLFPWVYSLYSSFFKGIFKEFCNY